MKCEQKNNTNPPLVWTTPLPPSDYPSLAAFFIVLVLYTQFDQYLYEGSGVILPLYWLAAAGVLALPLVFSNLLRLRVPTPPLTYAAFGYLLLIAWGWYRSDGGVAAENSLNTGILSFLVLGMLAVLLANGRAVYWARLAVLCALILGTILNWVEFLGPLNLLAPWAPRDICRAGGLYVNPNDAASALVFGLLIALPAVVKRTRAHFVVLVGLGVLPTVSRGGYVVWLIAVAVLLYWRYIDWRSFVKASVGAVLVVVAVLSFVNLTQSKAQYCIAKTGVFSRTAVLFDWMAGNREFETRYDSKALERAEEESSSLDIRAKLIREGMKISAESDFLGAGLGSTEERLTAVIGRPYRTHNMYVELLAQFGIFGLVYFVGLLVSLYRGRRNVPSEQPVITAFVLVYAAWSMLDHNMLDAFYKLVALGVQFAAITNATPNGGSLLDVLGGKRRFHGSSMVIEERPKAE